LEAVLEAAAALDSGAGAELTDLAFLRPLRLPDDGPVRLQLVLRPAEDGVRDVTVLAAAPGARWHQHLTGRLRTGPPPAPADREPPAPRRARATGQADLPALYGRFAGRGTRGRAREHVASAAGGRASSVADGSSAATRWTAWETRRESPVRSRASCGSPSAPRCWGAPRTTPTPSSASSSPTPTS